MEILVHVATISTEKKLKTSYIKNAIQIHLVTISSIRIINYCSSSLACRSHGPCYKMALVLLENFMNSIVMTRPQILPKSKVA